jgi:hypothetical protein
MFSKLNLLVVCFIVCAFSGTVDAQCTAANLLPNVDIATLEENTLVIDVRPDQINQFRGKSTFKNQARIALVNMNPFLFSYSLKVDQTEIQDTGFLNFLNLLGAPVSDLIGSVSASSRSAEVSTATGGNLSVLIARTAVRPTAPHSSCPAEQTNDARQALESLAYIRNLVVNTAKVGAAGGLDANIAATAGQFGLARNAFMTHKNVIFDSSVEAAPLCTAANTLGGQLTGYPHVNAIQNLLISIRNFQSLVDELKSSAQEYQSEYDDCPARIQGLSYAANLIRLADEFSKIGKAYETKARAMLDETKAYDALASTIAKLNNQMLQKEYTVESRYDISALEITATAEPLGNSPAVRTRDIVEQRVVGDISSAQASAASAQASTRVVSVGSVESAEGVKVFAPRGARATFRAQAASADGDSGGNDSGGGGGGGNNQAGAKQIKTTGVIGARRFQISGGMAFSSLGRREFQPVLGFPRNAEGEIIDPETGNPTTDRKLTNIVGLSEESKRRFAPIGMLHYRIPYTEYIFASVGLTGKRDEYGVDLEYLFGPSVLYRNLFLTFGAYAGKQQRLAGDLFQGAAIEGDTIPVRKEYKWGLGFSLTFKIPLGDKKTDN